MTVLVSHVQDDLPRLLLLLSQSLGKALILKVVVDCQHTAPPAAKTTVQMSLP